VFFFLGPKVVFFVPRCMPGTLLIHIGIDLTREALYDSLGGFDYVEYMIIASLSGIITVWGMTQGLLAGVAIAAIAFIWQTNIYVSPIRRSMRCTTMRSSKWRTGRALRALPSLLRKVLWIQLQGSIFFGNALVLAKEMTKLIEAYDGDVEICIVDFTLVLSIDSSAVDAIKDLAKVGEATKCALIYVRGSAEGFPCASGLSDMLKSLRKKSKSPLRVPRAYHRTSTSSSSSLSMSALALSSVLATSSCDSDGNYVSPQQRKSVADAALALQNGGYDSDIYIVDELDAGIMLSEELLLHNQTDLKDNKKEKDFQEYLLTRPAYLHQLQYCCTPRELDRLMGYFRERQLEKDQI